MAPRVEAATPGRTIFKELKTKACIQVALSGIRMNPAPMMMAGEGMGIITCSIKTPTNTLDAPWARSASKIHAVICPITGSPGDSCCIINYKVAFRRPGKASSGEE
jgi:hypothetical protein